MPVFVKIVKNNNAESAAYGKHYGKVVSSQTMTYRELIKHMSEHITAMNAACTQDTPQPSTLNH